MSYRPNQSQQLSIFDRNLRLTERERKCLEKSWAKVFSDEIGKGCAALEIFRGVAVPLELRQHIALGVVGILLDPAVGIGQLDGTVGINVYNLYAVHQFWGNFCH